MDTPTFSLLAVSFLVLSFVLVLLILTGLKKTLPFTSFPAQKQKRIYNFTIMAIMLWVTAISLLALNGVFSDFSTMPPKMMIAILPLFFTLLAITVFSKNLQEILRHVPPAWMLYIQSFRVIVEILLWVMFMQNLIPVQMSFEGKNFDIVAGLTAPFAAWFCFGKGAWKPQWAIAWNIAGLLLLFNIVSIAVLSFPTPFRIFMNDPSSAIVTTFPFVLLPGILVPVAYTMHFFSIRQLMMKEEKTETRFAVGT